MIFAVFDVSLIACRRLQVYKLVFCTFIKLIRMEKVFEIFYRIKSNV